MRIAYLCLCHQDPEFIKRLCKVLRYEEDVVFLHVDKKMDQTPFYEATKNMDNVVFLKDSLVTYWGGFSSVRATVHTAKCALQYGNFDRFVLLQGQDYPLMAPKDIHDFFEQRKGVELCKAKDITVSKVKREWINAYGYWSNDLPRSPLETVKWFVGKCLNRLGLKYRKGYFKRKDGSIWHIYQGWAQFAISRECMEYLIHVFETDEEYNRFMEHRFPPDETYFHTILYNTEYHEKISKEVVYYRKNSVYHGAPSLINITYFEYPGTVTVWRKKDDYEFLKKTGCIFARKLNSSSKELLDEIDRHIL